MAAKFAGPEIRGSAPPPRKCERREFIEKSPDIEVLDAARSIAKMKRRALAKQKAQHPTAIAA
jgi:hypothetical protein